jgi:hypothetical protein
VPLSPPQLPVASLDAKAKPFAMTQRQQVKLDWRGEAGLGRICRTEIRCAMQLILELKSMRKLITKEQSGPHSLHFFETSRLIFNLFIFQFLN